MSKETKLNLTPEQLKAITAPLEPALVIAGAGTGKTSVMAERVLWLVSEAGIDPAEILGLTFTNKAAQELRIRVRETLNKVDKYQSAFDLVEPNVSTYHAFAMQILNDHGLLIGVESDLKPVTETTRAGLAFKTVLNTKLSLADTIKYTKKSYIDSSLLTKINTTGNAATATIAGNITATSNTTLTSLSNLATVGTITSGVWSGTAVAVEKGGTGLTVAGTSGQDLMMNAPSDVSEKQLKELNIKLVKKD